MTKSLEIKICSANKDFFMSYRSSEKNTAAQKQAEFAFHQASPAEVQIQQSMCFFFFLHWRWQKKRYYNGKRKGRGSGEEETYRAFSTSPPVC